MNKKNSNKTMVPAKVMKGFRFYAVLVLVVTMMTALGVTAFAADGDPIEVVNNLSDFIFGLIRAVGPQTDSEILELFGEEPLLVSTLEKDACKTYEEAVRFCRDRFYDLDGKPLNGGRA